MDKKESSIKKTVIVAAGLGTRFLPATKAQPKEMLPIVDKPVMQYLIEESVSAGIDDVLIVTGRDKRAIEDHFDKNVELNSMLRERNKMDLLSELEKIENMASIHYIRQKEPLGLGHAVLCAKKHVGNEPFALFYGDDLVLSKKPAIQQLIEVYERHNSGVIGVAAVPDEDIPKYGIIKYKKVNNDLMIEDLIEKPSLKEAPSNLAVLGRLILKPGIFKILEETPFGIGNELQLTDALRIYNNMEKMMAKEIDGKWLTVGDRLSYLKAVIEYALDRKDLSKELKAYLKSVI
ncbi:MAG: UTP--glucose-1-phosphate uridylyltransferase GalU [archaeon]